MECETRGLHALILTWPARSAIGFRSLHLCISGPCLAGLTVKFFLTDPQGLDLLCIGGRRNLTTVRSVLSKENVMTDETLAVRLAQALLAVTATAASIFVVQFALLAG